MIPSDLMPFWLTLGRPLTRLLFAMCIGLLIANIVEALRWTQPLARLSAPPMASLFCPQLPGRPWPSSLPSRHNALLSDSHAKGRDQPARARARQPVQQPARLHGPSADHACSCSARARRSRPYYTGLTLAATALRTLFTRCISPAAPSYGENCIECRLPQEKSPSRARRAQGMETVPPPPAQTRHVHHHPRVRRHVPDAAHGLFRHRRGVAFRPYPRIGSGFIRPEALGIVLLSLAAEIGASLVTAGSALHMGGPTPPSSSPCSSRQHPPPYADRPSPVPGLCRVLQPSTAFKLIFYNQLLLRTITMIGMGLLAMRHRLRNPAPRLLQGLQA